MFIHIRIEDIYVRHVTLSAQRLIILISLKPRLRPRLRAPRKGSPIVVTSIVFISS